MKSPSFKDGFCVIVLVFCCIYKTTELYTKKIIILMKFLQI